MSEACTQCGEPKYVSADSLCFDCTTANEARLIDLTKQVQILLEQNDALRKQLSSETSKGQMETELEWRRTFQLAHTPEEKRFVMDEAMSQPALRLWAPNVADLVYSKFLSPNGKLSVTRCLSAILRNEENLQDEPVPMPLEQKRKAVCPHCAWPDLQVILENPRIEYGNDLTATSFTMKSRVDMGFQCTFCWRIFTKPRIVEPPPPTPENTAWMTGLRCECGGTEFHIDPLLMVNAAQDIQHVPKDAIRWTCKKCRRVMP